MYNIKAEVPLLLWLQKICWIGMITFSMAIIDAQAMDVTGQIVFLGNPFKSRYGSLSSSFVRSVWDMQRDGEMLYLGHGDYSSNSGPTDIWVYIPKDNKFYIEKTIQQEQIEHYTYLNGLLTIPGIDPSGSGNEGYYTHENGNWIPHVINVPFAHCFDVASSGTTLIAGLGTDTYTNSLAVSINGGMNWKTLNIISSEPNSVQANVSRAYTVFEWQGGVYGSGWGLYYLSTPSGMTYPRSHLIQFGAPDKGQLMPVATSKAMLPGVTIDDSSWNMERPVHYGDKLIYIAATAAVNTWQPQILCVADRIGVARKISLQDNASAYDIVVGDDGKCYVLGNIKISDTQNIVTVNVSTDLITWTELFRFQSPTLARSFEYLNGSFYFGLGCTSNVMNDASGNILRYALPITDPVLTVISPHGTPIPNNGSHSYTSGTLISASMTGSPVIDTTGTTRLICTGWIGSGAVVASGSTTQTSVILNSDSSLTWQWKTQYRLDAIPNTVAGGSVLLNGTSVSPEGTWLDSGITTTVRATANPGYVFGGWSGDSSNATTTVSVNMTQPKRLVANFIQTPFFKSQAKSQTVDLGTNVTFSLNAGGSPPLLYQWFRDGSVLEGQTSATLQLTSVNESAEGNYTCRISNTGGDAVSSGAYLQVLRPGTLSATPSALHFLQDSLYAANMAQGGSSAMQSLKLTNTGEKPLSFIGGDPGMPGLALTGPCAADYTVQSVTPSTTSPLAPGDSVTVTVRFAPTEPKVTLGLIASLKVTSTSPVMPTLNIPLQGDVLPVDLSSFSAE